MANYDQRVQLDDRFGQLSASVVASATLLRSPEFTTLPSDLSATRYLPVVLADDSASTKTYEIVWATGHVEGSDALTVVRGREGSTARVWGPGTAWRCAPTARDVPLSVANRAGLPADAHLGMRCLIRDDTSDNAGRARVVEKVSAGWRATEPIFGHAGRTAGYQAGSGVVVMTAGQDLQGDMRFSGGGLVVPIAGRYQVSIRPYVSGGTAGRYTAAPRVNGAVPAQSGPVVQATKADTTNDYSAIATQLMTLAALDVLTFAVTIPAGDSVWGTTGYDGAWIEALYLGP